MSPCACGCHVVLVLEPRPLHVPRLLECLRCLDARRQSRRLWGTLYIYVASAACYYGAADLLWITALANILQLQARGLNSKVRSTRHERVDWFPAELARIAARRRLASGLQSSGLAETACRDSCYLQCCYWLCCYPR